MAQNGDRRNNVSHGTESLAVTFVAHNRFGNDTLMTRFRSDDIV